MGSKREKEYEINVKVFLWRMTSQALRMLPLALVAGLKAKD